MANNIFKSSLSLRMYRALDSEDTPISGAAISTGALRHAYMDTLRDTPTADYVYGFCSPMDMTVSELAGDHGHNFGEDVAVGYRISRKKVDPVALRQALKARTIDHVATWNATHPDNQIEIGKLTKQTKASLVDACVTDLLPTTNWREKMCGVFYLAEYGLLLISGATEKEADKIALCLQQCTEDATRFRDIGVLELPTAFGIQKAGELDAMLDTFAQNNASYGRVLSDAMRHLWFLGETLTGTIASGLETDSHNYTFQKHGGHEIFDVGMSEDTVICGEFLDEKIIGETVCSKGSDHAPVRYAMWKHDAPLVSCSLYLSNDMQTLPNVGMSALKLNVVTLRNVTTKVKDNATDEQLEASVILYMDRVSTALHMVATVIDIFLTARSSEGRWADTRKSEREWLEAYAPPCEAALERIPANTTITTAPAVDAG